MADHANSTPGAVSRRFLLSVAAAVPIAAVTAKSSTASADSASRLATILLAYRDVGLRLQTLDAELAAAMESVPEWVLPGVGSDGKTCRWAEWPRSELDDLGLPSFMTSRPSLADLQEFNRRSRLAAPQDEIGNRAPSRPRQCLDDQAAGAERVVPPHRRGRVAPAATGGVCPQGRHRAGASGPDDSTRYRLTAGSAQQAGRGFSLGRPRPGRSGPR
jgi:hypothetical protein